LPLQAQATLCPERVGRALGSAGRAWVQALFDGWEHESYRPAFETTPMANPTARKARHAPGRTFGKVVFGVLVGGITAILSGQILRVTLFPETPPLEVDCSTGVRELWTSLQRARRSAVDALDDEQGALQAFRDELGPEWERLPSVQAHCQTQPQWREAVATLAQLRFEEEHALRMETRSIAAKRQRARALLEALDQKPVP
jgi:hypothetical protein